MGIVVVDYDPSWPETFRALSARVEEALGDIVARIEHVGSTSVPGLAAKPVIDLDVVVAAEDVPEAKARLEALGYASVGDLGIPDREAFRAPAGSPRHNLYLCPEHSRALANHLAIRARLRSDPDAAREYGALKKRLAAAFANDMESYVEAKTAFLVRLLRESGFSETEIERIERMNRRRTPRGSE